jgi:LacI family transcriptional regulator
LESFCPFVSAEFFSEFLTGLDQEAQGSGYFLVVSTSHRHSEEFESAMQAMRKRVDGMIVMAPELMEMRARRSWQSPRGLWSS